MTERPITMRPADHADIDILWRFLAIAANEPSVEAARAIPVVAQHLLGWKRQSDFGAIALLGDNPVGAVWARQFSLAEEPSVFVNQQTPEVSIAVDATLRGQGVGLALLRFLIAEAEARRVGLCLNVRDTNPAMHLYERVGFVRLPEASVRNRVGGWSHGMLRTVP